jgi:hypothetical protein
MPHWCKRGNNKLNELLKRGIKYLSNLFGLIKEQQRKFGRSTSENA